MYIQSLRIMAVIFKSLDKHKSINPQVCTVKREKPTRCNKSDVYYQTFIPTRFGHHYAHHQENKSVHCRIWCSALVVMAVVVWSWDASTQLASQLHTTTANTTSAEHHMRQCTFLFS